MRKLLLSLALLVAGAMTVGAQTPAPVLELSQFGNYPYELSEADAEKVFALDDLTIAVQIDAPANISERRALFATSDPTKEVNSGAEGTNSRYVAYGMNGADVGYLASWKSGDRFTGGAAITADATNMVVVYVVNPTDNNFLTYINGSKVTKASFENKHEDGFMQGYEIATPKMVKADYTDAKIYIGGGKHSGGNGEVFNGKIKNVRVYNGALTAEEIAAIKPILDITEELNALNAAIEEAAALFNKIDEYIGEGVGKYSTSIPDYATKFDAVKEFCDAVDTTKPTPEEVNAKTAEVEALIASFTLNMPEAGKFYTFKNDSYYITCNTIETGNKNIALSEEKGDEVIYYFDGTHLLAYKTGLYIGLNANDWGFEAVGSNDISTIEFVAAADGTVAKYNIKSGGRWLHRTNAFVNRCSSNTCGGAHNWTIEEVETLPVTISTAGYATLNAPVALTVPANVTAYTGALNNEKTCLTLTAIEAGSTIPANTAVVLKGTADTYDFTITTADAFEGTNHLQGTTAAVTTVSVGTIYTLQNYENGVAFRKYAGDNLKGFGAYLPNVSSSANAIGIRYEDGTTGITEINVQNSEIIYDLMGRRVETMTEGGIYIVNGKKVIR